MRDGQQKEHDWQRDARRYLQYREQQNPVSDFLQDRYELTDDRGDEVKAEVLLEQYNEWARERKERRLNSPSLGLAIKPLHVKSRKQAGRVIYLGLKERPEPVSSTQGASGEGCDSFSETLH